MVSLLFIYSKGVEMLHHVKKIPVILLAAFLLLTLSAFQAQTAPTPAPGGLLQYTSQSDFESAFPLLPKEDFEESPIADGAFAFCTGPIDTTTNQPGCFVPGDILPGISFDNTTHSLWVLGTGYAALTTLSVTFGGGASPLSISFSSNDVHAVGMDLITFNGTDTYTVEVYGAGNVLLSTITTGAISTSGTFFGVFSPQPITKITLLTAIDEVIDNIQFGTKTTSDVTFYTNQATFETAHPGLPVEDFEESPVADGTLVAFPQPLNKTTNAPGAFAPGDILDDINIQTITDTGVATALQVVGDNYLASMGNPSKVVCDGPTGTDLQVMFINQTATELEIDTYAIGMDLWQWAPSVSPPLNGIVAVYDILGRLLGTTTVSVSAGQGNFVGMSSNEVIFYITFQLSGSPSECIDNIQYGGSVDGLTFYRTEDDFKKARSNLPMEDFSESPVPDNTPQLCSEPIDSATNEAGCFAPGDILPNISFQTESSLHPACPTCMILYGPNIPPLMNTSPLLLVPSPDNLEIAFSGKKIHFTGMELYLALISIYGPNDTLLGTSIRYPAVAALGFWGVKSTKPISRITISGGAQYLSEVSFGGKFPWPLFIPKKKLPNP